MPPAVQWQMVGGSSPWCSLGGDDSSHGLPFHHASASQPRRLSSALCELAPGCQFRQRPRPASSSVATSFGDTGKTKNPAAEEEEKEHPKNPKDKAMNDDVKAEDMKPEFHGKTENNEECRCLPNSVEPPKAAWLMRKGAAHLDGEKRDAREAHRHIFRQRLDEVESGTRDQLLGYYKAEKIRDEAYEDLHIQHKRAELAAAELKEAFADVKEAFTEGDCAKVVEKAQAEGQEVPECKTKFDKVAEEMKEIRSLIKPSCNDGAVSLTALQPFGAKELAAAGEQVKSTVLPPDLVAALMRLTQPEMAKYAPLQQQQQRRAFRAQEFQGFL